MLTLYTLMGYIATAKTKKPGRKLCQAKKVYDPREAKGGSLRDCVPQAGLRAAALTFSNVS